MAQKPKQTQKDPAERDLSKRPDLPEQYQKRITEIKKNAENKVFLSFGEGDTAAVELLNRDVIQSKVGANPAWTARYHEGNIHGTGGGAPERKGNVFRFWESTVLASKFRELNVGQGAHVVILCLGDKEGGKFTYKDFEVEVLSFSPKDDQLPEGKSPEVLREKAESG